MDNKLKCPKCGRKNGSLFVRAFGELNVVIDIKTGGFKEIGLARSAQIVVQENHIAECMDCAYKGPMRDFIVKKQKEKKEVT